LVKNFNEYCYIEGYYNSETKVYADTAAAVKAMKKCIHKRVGNGPARDIFDETQTIPKILDA